MIKLKQNKKDDKLLKKADMVLLFLVIIMAVIGTIYINLSKKQGKEVCISIDGKIKKTFPISDDIEYEIKTDEGTNLLVIKDGMASVVKADCKDKVCVNYAPISETDETIICLPHKLVIEIR